MALLGSVFGPNTIAGAASVTIAGQPYNLVGELAYQPNTFTAETLKGMDGVHGRSIKPDAPYMKFKIRDALGMTVATFMAMDSVTVTAVLASGKSVSGDGMWCEECSEVNTEDASFELKFAGRQLIEG